VTRHGDIEVIDKFAERQAGYAPARREDLDVPRSPAPSTPARRTRTRRGARAQAQAMTALPTAQENKFYVRLDRGQHYRLAEPDLTFEPGKVHEVSEAVWQHLMSAVDVLPTTKDPEYGRVVRRRHKFAASPPYEVIQDVYPDLVEC
jgi:hypothetical protein